MSGAEVVAVDVDRATGVTITWDDGVTAHFGLAELRAACPCAACRARRDRGEVAWPVGGGPAEVGVADAELVGAWGLSFTWDDGHGTGIYPWDSLRRWAEARPGNSVPPPP